MRFDVSTSVRRPGGFRLEAAFACEADALGIVGPSGSGKSTLLDAIAGVEPGGRIVLDGRDRSGIPLHRRRVGYVAQDPLLFPHLDLRANLSYSPLAGPPEEVAQVLGIAHLLDRMPRNLSGGERRRAALARALLGRPEILLLDEPFSGLDAPLRREAISHLLRVRERFALPMVVVTHIAEEAAALTDWVIRLDAGRVVASGPSLSILRPGEPGIDNHFVGRVVAPNRVRVGDAELSALLPEGVSGDLRLAVYAHDILLATDLPRGVSARNGLRTTVASAVPAGGGVLVGLTGLPFKALVTPEAQAEMGLAVGSPVAVLLKATAIACLGGA